jgi:hypothetical protein
MDEVLATGQLGQFYRRSKIVAARPDMLFVKTQGDDLRRTIWFAEGELAVWDEVTQEYTQIETPKTTDAMLDHIVQEHGLTIPVADVLSADPYSVLTENAQSGKYIGLHDVDGVPCHHLAFRQEVVDWQIWIASEGPAVPRKLVIVYKREEGHPAYTVVMDEWKLGAEFPHDRFPFKAPQGAKKVTVKRFLEKGEQQ